MLSKVKLALRRTTNAFDSELLDLIGAGIEDLKLDGTSFTYTTSTNDYVIDDALVAQAVITYCKLHSGQPDNYDQLKKSYDEQKAQLRAVPKYTAET